MLQLGSLHAAVRIPRAAARTRRSLNKYIFFKKEREKCFEEITVSEGEGVMGSVVVSRGD